MAGMPHTTAPSSIPLTLKAIQDATVPGKVTAAFLEANGIPAGEGGHVVGMLRSLGFVDGAGRPTLTWNRYRRPDHAGVVLAGALRNAYAPLFVRYPDAPDRDLASLAKVIRRHTEYSEHHVTRTAECFLALTQHANFSVSVIQTSKSPASRQIRLTPHERLLAMRRLTAAYQEALECTRHGCTVLPTSRSGTASRRSPSRCSPRTTSRPCGRSGRAGPAERSRTCRCARPAAAPRDAVLARPLHRRRSRRPRDLDAGSRRLGPADVLHAVGRRDRRLPQRRRHGGPRPDQPRRDG
ncbi:DUF5343 domain-containing protein [Aeromicrobium sp. UC242_57]|uniref:DUF5343 domain-containing protein n=1 Tax=Aeromicrobium sp. UC242_57 TaxID=3374624 RepID=UPI0037A529C9